MKRLMTILLALAVLPAARTYAQTSLTTGKWEFEPKLEFNVPLAKLVLPDENERTTTGLGSGIALEVRYNLTDNLDIGLEAFRSVTARNLYVTMEGEEYEFRRLASIMNGVALVADYSFKRGRWLSFFAGGSIGYSLTVGPTDFMGGTAIVSPRCGVELWNRLRIGVQSRLCYRYANNVGVTVGYSFGGRPR